MDRLRRRSGGGPQKTMLASVPLQLRLLDELVVERLPQEA